MEHLLVVLMHELLDVAALLISLLVVQRASDDHRDLVITATHVECGFIVRSTGARALTELSGIRLRLVKFARQARLLIVLGVAAFFDSVLTPFVFMLLFYGVLARDEKNPLVHGVELERLCKHVLVHAKAMLHAVHDHGVVAHDFLSGDFLDLLPTLILEVPDLVKVGYLNRVQVTLLGEALHRDRVQLRKDDVFFAEHFTYA